MDLKNTLECLKLANDAAVATKAAMADGKLDWKDIPKVVGLFKPAQVTLQDIKIVPAELKDLDDAEAAQLMDACVAVANAWAAVFAST